MNAPWHHWELERVFAEIHSQPAGLSYTDVRKRLRNRKKRTLPYLLIPFGMLPLLWYFPFRSWLLSGDSLMMGAILGWQALIHYGLSQGIGTADRLPTAAEAIVRRDNRYLRIPRRSVVPGDILWIKAGSSVVADIRLVALQDLCIAQPEEGKWIVTPKDTVAALPIHLARSEQSNMVYQGAEVVEGEGFGVVVHPPHPRGVTVASKLQDQMQRLQLGGGIAGWLGVLLMFWRGQSLQTIVVFGLFVFTILVHIPRIFTYCQVRGLQSLQELQITLRFPAIVEVLGQIDTIVFPLDFYGDYLNSSNLTQSNLSWRGLWHGRTEEVKELSDRYPFPVQAAMEGLVLPPAKGVGLCCETVLDQSFIPQSDLVIASRTSEPPLQASAGMILPTCNPDLIIAAAAVGRITSERVRRVLLSLVAGGMALLIGVVLATLLVDSQETVAPKHILWTGIILPIVLAGLLLVEPDSGAQGFLGGFGFLKRGLLSTGLMVIPAAVLFGLFYQGDVLSLRLAQSLASSTFFFSQVGHFWSLIRTPIYQSPRFLGTIAAAIALQVTWVQTGWLDTAPLDATAWLIAIATGSIVFWVNELL